MNIFYLDHNPYIAAQWHGDKHVVKMIVETAQMLSTAHHILLPDKDNRSLYKPTHKNHPCNIWVRETESNYNWTFQLLEGLCYEFYFRRSKIHATQRLLKLLENPPDNIPKTSYRTKPALAMPTIFKTKSAVYSYRRYYKSKFNEGIVSYDWSEKRKKPWWL